MRNFILGGLLVSSVVACTTTSDLGHVSATWHLDSVDGAGNVTAAACPAGFDTAELHTVAASPDGVAVSACQTASSDCFIDVFNCSDFAGLSAPLPAQNYLTWIEITDHAETTTYATSTAEFVDITAVDMNFDTRILIDGGYFKLSWSLVGASSGSPLLCADTAAASSAGGSLEVTSTISGTATALSDKFNCEDHFGYSAPLPSDNYTIAIDALNSSDQAISEPTTLTKTIGSQPNTIVDLGHIMIPITGQ